MMQMTAGLRWECAATVTRGWSWNRDLLYRRTSLIRPWIFKLKKMEYFLNAAVLCAIR